MLWMNSSVESYFNLFLIISAIHGFVFCGIALFSKMKKEKSLRYLALLVLMISLSNFQTWGIKPLLATNSLIHYLYYPWHFLIGVFFYRFLMNYIAIRTEKETVFITVVFFFVFVIFFRIGYVFRARVQGLDNLSLILKRYTSIEELVSLFFSLGCFVYSFVLFKRKEKQELEIESGRRAVWLHKFFRLGGLNYLLWAMALLMTIFVTNYEFRYWYYPLNVFSAILIYWLGYEGYSQIRLIKEREEIQLLYFKEKKVQKREKRLHKTQSKEIDKFQKVEAYILANKRFTDAKISLELLSLELGIGITTLSQLFHKCAKKSFPDYINYLRVEQAKRMLKDEAYKNYTVLAIGLEAGFNSKSTFYAAFKKQVGCTPTVYKNNNV